MGSTKIFNRYTNSITWLDGGLFDAMSYNKADIWRINIRVNLPILDDFRLILRSDEIERANRYVQTKDSRRFIVSRGALRHILGRYLSRPPASIELGEGVNKKPLVLNPADTGLYYNVSHSGDWIMIAIASSEIGVDIEFINPVFDFNEVMPDIFKPDEISFVRDADSTRRFFMLWTRKEALVKATGQGLDENFMSIPGLDGEHAIDNPANAAAGCWQVTSFDPDENHVASLAYDLGISEIRFWDLNFNNT